MEPLAKGQWARPPGDARAAPSARLARFLRDEAARLGFVDLAIGPADLPEGADARLRRAIADGHMGTMTWMEETEDRRRAPTALWPQARSAIVLATNYAPAENPLSRPAGPESGVISVYAARRDYHEVIKGRLKELAGKMMARARVLGLGEGELKVFVDTAPLMEKPLAAIAGLGWQGRHTNLVSRKAGSWTFLGTILTTLDLPHDAPAVDRCGSCRACLDICPTSAFPEPYRLDARRCVSYLTIEHAGPIPADLRPLIGNRIYGCDDCLAVCPWNKFARAASDARLALDEDLLAPDLLALSRLDDAAFRARFAGTPVKRIGRDRFLRNVLIAMGNSGVRALAEAARAHLDDPAPVVRGAAVWALSRLDPATALAERDARRDREVDQTVRIEWDAATVPDMAEPPTNVR